MARIPNLNRSRIGPPKSNPVKVGADGLCPKCGKPRGTLAQSVAAVMRCTCGGNVINDKWVPKDKAQAVMKREFTRKKDRRARRLARHKAKVAMSGKPPNPVQPTGRKRPSGKKR